MRKKILFLTLMILICFTINSVCAQSLDNVYCADNDGFEDQNLIDCNLHEDSSLNSLKSNRLSEKKTTTNAVKQTNAKTSNSIKMTDAAKAAASNSVKKTDAAKAATSNTVKKTNATKTTTKNSSSKNASSAKENITSVNTKTLAKSSSGFMAYVDKNAKLQDPITISNKKYKSSDYLYLLSKAVSNISKTKVEIKDKLINNYSNAECKSANGTINKTEYVKLASKTVSFIEKNHRAPNWISSSKGNIPRTQLILAFSKCLDYYNNNSKLPGSIKLNDLDLNKIKQKINSSKELNSTKKTNTKTNSTSTKKTNTTNTKKTNSTSTKKTNSTSTKKTNTTNTKTNSTSTKNTNATKTTGTSTNKSLVETTLDSINAILNNIINKLNPEVSATKSNKNTVTVNSSNVNVKISGTSTVNVKISTKNKKTSTTTGKTNTSSTKKTNTTSAKKTNTTSAKKTSASNAKKTNSTKNTVKGSSMAKYLNTSILNDKYLGDSLKKYLSASKNCQVNSKLIKSLAKNLTSTLKTEYKKGEKIFNWVRDNIGYEKYRNTKKGALQTLKSKKGNCVDHAHLIVALSRAAGLPARYVNANNCKFTSGMVSGHVWAQVLVGNTWVVADATSSRNNFGVVKNWNVNSYKLVGKYSSLSF